MLLTLKGVTSIAVAAPAKRSHVLFCEGERSLQLCVRLEPYLDERSILTEAVLSTSQFAPRIRSLACLNDLMCGGRLLGRHFQPEFRRHRLAEVLRCLDASLQSASHRDVAIAVYGRKRVDADWSDPREHLRDSVRRAIARGSTLMRTGYLKYLR